MSSGTSGNPNMSPSGPTFRFWAATGCPRPRFLGRARRTRMARQRPAARCPEDRNEPREEAASCF
eukprot:14637625-Heterocapsa_arctica.AAC.1